VVHRQHQRLESDDPVEHRVIARHGRSVRAVWRVLGVAAGLGVGLLRSDGLARAALAGDAPQTVALVGQPLGEPTHLTLGLAADPVHGVHGVLEDGAHHIRDRHSQRLRHALELLLQHGWNAGVDDPLLALGAAGVVLVFVGLGLGVRFRCHGESQSNTS
jgi:hypothetical protein